MDRERVEKIIDEEFKDYMPKGFNFYELIKKSADRIIAEEEECPICKDIHSKHFPQPQQPKLPEKLSFTTTDEVLADIFYKINEIIDYLKAKE